MYETGHQDRVVPVASLLDYFRTSIEGVISEQGVDVNNAIMMLSVYLGHSKVTDTYWYLTGIPSLMAIAAKRFERFSGGEKWIDK